MADLRDRLEHRLAAFPLDGAFWLSKSRLDDLARCQGWYAADLAGERGPFVYGFKVAVGAVVHRAVQADVASERSLDARTLVDHAVSKQLGDRQLAEHWSGLAEVERHEILAEATRQFAMFREMFAPFERGAQPLSELKLKLQLLGGRITLFGRPDLVLGRPPSIVVDFKTGDPHPEHVEDGRFYALLLTLMFGRPAALTATAYLDSLELQPEEIEPHVLERAADRVVEAVRAASLLLGGRAPETLTPGPYCRWCPRSETCPANLDREDVLA
ncbi:MAG: PD-(D/E)XK nuclease family protein [Actinomycetota bacterium]